jgi:hypothetical protein
MQVSHKFNLEKLVGQIFEARAREMSSILFHSIPFERENTSPCPCSNVHCITEKETI